MTQDVTGSPPGPVNILSTKDGYDAWSKFYDTDDNPLVALEEPWVDRLLGDVRGLTVADIGCGTGRHALRLAGAGATIHALDFSEGMLARARAKAGNQKIVFCVHDLAQPLPLADAMFDRVVCGLVLDHIADLVGLFREMHRICRPSAFVVISVMHPAMMLRGVQARFREPTTGCEIRPASIPNQLTDYIMAAVRAGFVFDHLSEQSVDEALATRLERARKYVGWPMLFLMKLAPTKCRA
ncbi:MAG TPA: class I SAM-dependent methyltransferase [Verrucomicrobiae bacterium]|nr:class I SAM-dependent methyltransferase [Verrucomicrobiae bacterium]